MKTFGYFWMFVLGICAGQACTAARPSEGAGPSACDRELEICKLNLAMCIAAPKKQTSANNAELFYDSDLTGELTVR